MLPRLSSMFEYTTGSAMRNVTSTERFRELTHTSARTVILATGTAFTAATSGARSVRTKRNFEERQQSAAGQPQPEAAEYPSGGKSHAPQEALRRNKLQKPARRAHRGHKKQFLPEKHCADLPDSKPEKHANRSDKPFFHAVPP